MGGKQYHVLATIVLVCLISALALSGRSVRAADCAATYDSFGKSFMERYCTRCHASGLTGWSRKGAPRGYDFDLPEKIAEHKAEILKWVIDKNAMPPRGDKPTPEEREQLKQWLGCEYQ